MPNFTVSILFPSPVVPLSVQRESKGSCSDTVVITPPRLMTARKLMGDRVTQTAAEELKEGEATVPNALATTLAGGKIRKVPNSTAQNPDKDLEPNCVHPSHNAGHSKAYFRSLLWDRSPPL